MSLTTGSNPCIGPVGQPDRYQVISVIGQGGQAQREQPGEGDERCRSP